MRRLASKLTAVEGILLHPAVLGAMAIIGLVAALGFARAMAQTERAGGSWQRGQPKRLAAVDGLSAPEALIFDPARNVYFVSNVNGTPGVKDGNGFISRINAEGEIDSLHVIQGRATASGLQHTGPDRIYRISRDRQITVAIDTSALNQPDGIAWDAHGRRMLLAPIGGPAVQTWQLTQPAPVDLPGGAGSFDGIEVERAHGRGLFDRKPL